MQVNTNYIQIPVTFPHRIPSILNGYTAQNNYIPKLKLVAKWNTIHIKTSQKRTELLLIILLTFYTGKVYTILLGFCKEFQLKAWVQNGETFMYPKPEWQPYLLFLGVGLEMDGHGLVTSLHCRLPWEHYTNLCIVANWETSELLRRGPGALDSPTRAAWTDHDWASSQV